MKTETETLASVAELNAIQAEWMKLDPNAPEKEKARVFALMRRLPRRFISTNDGKHGVVQIDATPMSAWPMPMDYCMALVQKHGGRADVTFSNGEWKEIASL